MLVRLQSSEALCCFLHRRRGPAQRHRGRSPSLRVAADATHCAHDGLSTMLVQASVQLPGLAQHAADPGALGTALIIMLEVVAALLSVLRDLTPRACRLKASNAAPLISNIGQDHSPAVRQTDMAG